jgi:hypothetical protein
MINRMVLMASPSCTMFVDAMDFGRFETPTAERTIWHSRLLTGFEFFSFNAHRVFVRFHFASRSICVHLSKLSAEQQDL